ncbi:MULTISPECIES: phage tail assembly chaperone [Clostridium]|uniref:XkdN-like protein n=1 Tax=Clostridium frigoriphilum TaxID=443253 RepID=A0ABU7UX36_9CLOT|nr:XkdN-like protein [Clostridium sp. DSM 17811]MBU3098746.1 XkdN-like protein [Clostridium sp. DSM 17811]
MNTIDLLLGLDTGKIKKPTQTMELKRLSKLVKGKVEFKCQALDSDTYSEIQKNAVDMDSKGAIKGLNVGEMQTFMVLAGVAEPNLKDATLLKHYGAVTPKELLLKLLLPGELVTLYNLINDLSGFSEDTVEDIKN